MNGPKLRNSTDIDKAPATPFVGAALKTSANDKGGNQAQPDRPAQDVAPRVELTANSAGKYIEGISANSCGEIDALISDLRRLREKLVTDGGRLQQSIAEFGVLNQSVIKLTEVVSDSVAHVRAPSLAE
jgi:hypothetical protein